MSKDILGLDPNLIPTSNLSSPTREPLLGDDKLPGTSQSNRLLAGGRRVVEVVGSILHGTEAKLAAVFDSHPVRESLFSAIGRITGSAPKSATIVTELVKRTTSKTMEKRIFGQRLGDMIVEGATGAGLGTVGKVGLRVGLGIAGIGTSELILIGGGAAVGLSKAAIMEYLHQRKEFVAKEVEDAGLSEVKTELKEAFRINRRRMAGAALRGAIFGAVGAAAGVAITEMAFEGISPWEWWEKNISGIKLPEIHLPKISMPELHMPEVKLPEFHAPEIKLPEFKLPEFRWPPAAEQAQEAATASPVVHGPTGPVAMSEASAAPTAEVHTPAAHETVIPGAETHVPATGTPIPTAETTPIPQATATPEVHATPAPTAEAHAPAPAAEAPEPAAEAPAVPPHAEAPAHPIDHVTAPNGAIVSGSTFNDSLTYNGQPWHLVENGTKNIHHLLSATGQPGDIDSEALSRNMQQAANFWSHGQLNPQTNPDLYKVFHLSNGTSSIYNSLLNKNTLESLIKLGIVAK